MTKRTFSTPALAPSILSADFGRLADQIRVVETAGADLIHVDVMDGHFVPNITIGPQVVKAVRKATELPVDVHLMIENADRWVETFVDAGADMVSVHAEACAHLHRTVEAIRGRGARAGVVLNPATPLTALDAILPDVDYVLLMSVNPGFGGQEFIPAVRARIRALRQRIQGSSSGAQIEVDGGVDAGNAGDLVGDGAEILVAGAAVFGSGNPADAVRRLKAAAGGAAS
jgi:ribulose-phosphate 3-epimerase